MTVGNNIVSILLFAALLLIGSEGFSQEASAPQKVLNTTYKFELVTTRTGICSVASELRSRPVFTGVEILPGDTYRITATVLKPTATEVAQWTRVYKWKSGSRKCGKKTCETWEQPTKTQPSSVLLGDNLTLQIGVIDNQHSITKNDVWTVITPTANTIGFKYTNPRIEVPNKPADVPANAAQLSCSVEVSGVVPFVNIQIEVLRRFR